MSKTTYAGGAHSAIDKTKQSYDGRYSPSTIKPNVLVLHSTEGWDWPTYSGGQVAPNMTVKPDFANKRLLVRQHFAADHSSRALEHRPGTIATNTLNAFQIEIVGTCDPRLHAKTSTSHLYTPELPDWAIAGLAEIAVWLHNGYGLKLQDAAPRGWAAYPASGGDNAKTRMKDVEWLNAYGICGHEHVPHNSHGDPGAFPIARLVTAAKALTTPVKPTTPPPAPTVSFYDLVLLVANLAGYNKVTAPGVRAWKANVDADAKLFLAKKPDVLALNELSNRVINRMLGRLTKAISSRFHRGPDAGNGGRYVFADKTITIRHSGVYTCAKSTWFRGTKKRMAWAIMSVAGFEFGVAVYQLEYRNGTYKGVNPDDKRVDQALDFDREFAAILTRYGTPAYNGFMCPDTNSNSWVLAALVQQRHRINVAAGTKAEHAVTFDGWDGKSTDRFDYVIRMAAPPEGASDPTVEVLDTSHSDHRFIKAEVYLAKETS
jgi:hypothetical protein